MNLWPTRVLSPSAASIAWRRWEVAVEVAVAVAEEVAVEEAVKEFPLEVEVAVADAVLVADAVAVAVAEVTVEVKASQGEDTVVRVPVAPQVEVKVEASKDWVPTPYTPVLATLSLVM